MRLALLSPELFLSLMWKGATFSGGVSPGPLHRLGAKAFYPLGSVSLHLYKEGAPWESLH